MTSNGLTVFSVIKNGIQNGYPFVEAYSSWLNYCDRIFVLDGGSTDGTNLVLDKLSKISSKFSYETSVWPSTRVSGSSIADFTNECLRIVKPKSERLFYIQADEILSKNDRYFVSKFDQGVLKINKYILFWNSFYDILKFENEKFGNATAWEAIRLFPSSLDASSYGDGLSFKISDTQIFESQIEVYHYGWNFPINILQKHMSHANLYSDSFKYRNRAYLSMKLLGNNQHSRKHLRMLDPEYIKFSKPFIGQHPECIQHLVDQKYYDPYIGLNLLESGVSW
jgi:hypothetical protein